MIYLARNLLRIKGAPILLSPTVHLYNDLTILRVNSSYVIEVYYTYNTPIVVFNNNPFN